MATPRIVVRIYLKLLVLGLIGDHWRREVPKYLFLSLLHLRDIDRDCLTPATVRVLSKRFRT